MGSNPARPTKGLKVFMDARMPVTHKEGDRYPLGPPYILSFMLKHIENLKWVGVLSLEDADVLAQYGHSANILEFGSGGSTLIFAQVANNVVSIETHSDWIQAVEERLQLVPNPCPVSILSYEYVRDLADISQFYDVVFVDGLTHKRADFALAAWSSLKTGGVMLFHDTKRSPYIDHVLTVAGVKLLEIESAFFNVAASNGRASNITVIKKRDSIPPADDFQNPESVRELWTFGKLEYNKQIIENKLYQYKPPA